MTWGDWPNPSGGTWHQPEPEPRAPKRKRSWEEPIELPVRDDDSPPLVCVSRTVTKWVSDTEAEVLQRFGWRIIEDAIYEGSNTGIEGHTTPTQREEEKS